MTGVSLRSIYSLAEDQMGYVTTSQAAAAGVKNTALVMLERRKRIERVSRGVYRLVEFPTHPLAQYMQATLWPYPKRGILSHETALALYELSDVDPAKVHITLPATFRLQRTVPDYIVTHRARLADEDVTRLEAMPITTPARSIGDCIDAHLGPALVGDAIVQARQSGMIDLRAAHLLEAALRRTPSGGQ